MKFRLCVVLVLGLIATSCDSGASVPFAQPEQAAAATPDVAEPVIAPSSLPEPTVAEPEANEAGDQNTDDGFREAAMAEFIESGLTESEANCAVDAIIKAQTDPSEPTRLDDCLTPIGPTLAPLVEASAWARTDGLNERVNGTATGPDRIVAVGAGKLSAGQPVWTSPDGEQWTRLESEITGFAGATIVTWTTRGFVMVGAGMVWESDDGLEWSEPTRLSTQSDTELRIDDVIGAEDRVIAAGSLENQPALWISRSPGSWQVVTGFGNKNRTERIYATTFGQSGFVAVGFSGNADLTSNLRARRPATWFSPDGLEWAPTEIDGDFDDRGGLLTSVVWSDPLQAYYAAGWDGVGGQNQRAIMFTSPDGQTWTQLADPTFDRSDEDEKLDALYASPEGLIAVGGNEYAREPFGLIWHSVDGKVWESARLSGASFVFSVDATQNGLCVATGMSSYPGTGIIWNGRCDQLTIDD